MAVYKTNVLVGKRQSLSLQAHRVIYNCLSKVGQVFPLEEDTFYAIDIEDYAASYNLSMKTAFKDVKKAALDLKHADVYLQDDDRTLITGYVTDILYKEEGYLLAVKWNKEIIPHISGFLKNMEGDKKIWSGNVTKIDERIAIQQSPSTIRLYELLKRVEHKGKWKVKLEELKTILDVEVYDLYGDFKRRLLIPAMRDIAALTELKVTYEEIETKGQGKKVKELLFVFPNYKKKELTIPTIDIIFNRK